MLGELYQPKVLDATAGNRTTYSKKRDTRIVYIDIESELQIPPDHLIDCTCTGFPNKSFHTIIFDPPHSFGHTKNRSYNTSPNNRNVKPEWGHHQIPAYYGADKYPTKQSLIEFILKAAKEFHRVLMDDGWILFKWGEIHANVDLILTLFTSQGFEEIMRTSRRYREGSRGGVWVMLMKKREAAHD